MMFASQRTDQIRLTLRRYRDGRISIDQVKRFLAALNDEEMREAERLVTEMTDQKLAASASVGRSYRKIAGRD
jgi:hypothetical protein